MYHPPPPNGGNPRDYYVPIEPRLPPVNNEDNNEQKEEEEEMSDVSSHAEDMEGGVVNEQKDEAGEPVAKKGEGPLSETLPSDAKSLKETKVQANRKRPRPSAFAFLQGLVKEGSQEMSMPAQRILQKLLGEEGMHGQVYESPAEDVEECTLAITNERLQSNKKLVEASMTDKEIIELAKNDELFFLGSFLKVVEEGDGVDTSARHLCRRCCLAVNPVYVPAGMDAEDFSLAALAFLETSVEGTTNHPHVPRLPLLRATKEENDIRKRTYIKAYEWKSSDMMKSLAYLDYVFLSNSTDLKWLQREAFAPVQRLDVESEAALFLKGKFRAPSTKKKPPVSRKKAKTPTVVRDRVVEGSATQSDGDGGTTTATTPTTMDDATKEAVAAHPPP